MREEMINNKARRTARFGYLPKILLMWSNTEAGVLRFVVGLAMVWLERDTGFDVGVVPFLGLEVDWVFLEGEEGEEGCLEEEGSIGLENGGLFSLDQTVLLLLRSSYQSA